MSLLIYANEVIDTAFTESDQVDSRSISDYKIEAVQLKFLRPVFEEMYVAMTEGKYPDFIEKYIKPALAYYVKFAMIPELAVKAGNSGIMRNRNSGADPAGARDISILRTESKNIADSLIDKAISVMEQNPEMFPEYDPERNIRNRKSIKGGVVI